jgi:hypothetical protein
MAFSGTGTADFNVQSRVRHPTLYFSLDNIIVDYATGAIALVDVFYPPSALLNASGLFGRLNRKLAKNK